MSIEVELKLWLTEAMSPSLLSRIQQSWQQLAVKVELAEPAQLLNAYFETPDQWFRRHDSGLRSRLKKGRFEQTIKLAGQQQGAAHIRPEYNVPCDSVVPKLSAFPLQIWPEGTDVDVLQQQLQEMFRTDFIRHSALLTLADGTVLEAVLDQGEVVAGNSSQPILEMELELVSGDARQLFQLARLLCQQLPLTLGFQSKAERGYLLAQQQVLSWQQSGPEQPLSTQLRAFLQNLWLQQQSQALPAELAASFTARLQQQWLDLQQTLAQHVLAQQVLAEQALTQQQALVAATAQQSVQLKALLVEAKALAAAPGTGMTLWLLDLSELLLQLPAESAAHNNQHKKEQQ
ncbi:inorganic triphosphatase [Rheinheimera sp. 4Y26]|uniref:CYTH domain-containing protein n=1 Tax=Rheinheimera sp. 4Y26 TaxID=2977811 RepID=UPI0021B0B2F9|nr:CYTH domain-containing protein [Rheinheimera sp. 4Y26]MCT6698869.1 CYTH domain-containing protein [Rheinheimera sp. 4Y26]